MKYIVIFYLMFGFVCNNEEDLKKIDAIEQEEPCNKAGGTCTIVEDCPKGYNAKRQGLCPKQRDLGIECCHGVSTKETRCIKHGGVCMKSEENCNTKIIFDKAQDCTQNTSCCIMVS